MIKVFLVALSSLFLIGCNNSNNKTDSNEEKEIHSNHEHEENNVLIELNNGDKWTVNDEMKPFIIKGTELVETYISTKQENYKELSLKLKEQNNNLIQSCTMDGKSHEELHKWLHPHLELVEKLEKKEDKVKANSLVIEIQNSYKEYNKYFK